MLPVESSEAQLIGVILLKASLTFPVERLFSMLHAFEPNTPYSAALNINMFLTVALS